MPKPFLYPKDPAAALDDRPDYRAVALTEGRTLVGNRPRVVPKTVIREAMRMALMARVQYLSQVADDESLDAKTRMTALELLARYGVGTEDKMEHDVHRPLSSEERRQAIARVMARIELQDRAGQVALPAYDTAGGDAADAEGVGAQRLTAPSCG